jgi:hypothetical protein
VLKAVEPKSAMRPWANRQWSGFDQGKLCQSKHLRKQSRSGKLCVAKFMGSTDTGETPNVTARQKPESATRS